MSEVPDGNWMLLVIVAGHPGSPLTTPSGWTTLVGTFPMNTRSVAIMGKIKDSEDSVVAIPKTPTVTSTSIGVAYGSGGDDPSEWQIGTGKFRNESPAETTTTTALSITTTEPDVLY